MSKKHAAAIFLASVTASAQAQAGEDFTIDRSGATPGLYQAVVAGCVNGRPGSAMMLSITRSGVDKVLRETITPPLPTAPHDGTNQSFSFFVDSKGSFMFATNITTATRLQDDLAQGRVAISTDPALGRDADLKKILDQHCRPGLL